MKDSEIEKLINEINDADIYHFKDDFEDQLAGLKYRKSILYLKDELKLIRQPLNNVALLELTHLGNRVIKKGGWIEYQRIESEKEKRLDKKDIFDFKVSKFRYHTFWWFFTFALIGFGLGIYNFVESFLPSETIKKDKERIEKLESELEKIRTSFSKNTNSKDSLNSLQ